MLLNVTHQLKFQFTSLSELAKLKEKFSQPKDKMVAQKAHHFRISICSCKGSRKSGNESAMLWIHRDKKLWGQLEVDLHCCLSLQDVTAGRSWKYWIYPELVIEFIQSLLIASKNSEIFAWNSDFFPLREHLFNHLCIGVSTCKQELISVIWLTEININSL